MNILVISIILSGIALRHLSAILDGIYRNDAFSLPMIFLDPKWRNRLNIYLVLFFIMVIMNGYLLNGIAGLIQSFIGVFLISILTHMVVGEKIHGMQFFLFNLLLICFTLYNFFIGF